MNDKWDEKTDEVIKQSSRDDGDGGYEVSIKILRAKIESALRDAARETLERAAKAQCEFCREENFPAVFFEPFNLWAHQAEHRSTWCKSTFIRDLMERECPKESNPPLG